MRKSLGARRRRDGHDVDGGGAGVASWIGDCSSRVRGSFDRGIALPVGHSSIWFRQAAGFSPHDRDEPFANFFFGGFGNNYVDRGDEKRYRETYSMPGAELNEIGGRNFVKSMVELNLPPLRFQRLGTPGLLRAVDAAGGLRRAAWPPTSTIGRHGASSTTSARKWTSASRRCRRST